MTQDVETTSIVNHCLSDKTGEKVLKEGMPLLLDIYKKYKIRSTFFFTGYIAEKFPGIVKMILADHHEVASHGYHHDVDMAFDVLSLKEQIEQLKRSKGILEDISGHEVVSFRAPAGRVNRETPLALKNVGFKIDSSVSSQRFDMFFSFGSLKKLNWLVAPRSPYFTRDDNLWRSGDGDILEIPVSALLIPYIGTMLRLAPGISRMVRRVLHVENRVNRKPIVFLIHPNEFINEMKSGRKTQRRSKHFIGYLMGDKFRYKLKQRNLGVKACDLFRREIDFFYNHDYTFLTCKDFYDLRKIEEK